MGLNRIIIIVDQMDRLLLAGQMPRFFGLIIKYFDV